MSLQTIQAFLQKKGFTEEQKKELETLKNNQKLMEINWGFYTLINF